MKKSSAIKLLSLVMTLIIAISFSTFEVSATAGVTYSMGGEFHKNKTGDGSMSYPRHRTVPCLAYGKTKLEKAFADTIERIQDQIEQKELQLSTYTPIRYEAFDFDLIEIELADIEKAKEIYRKLIKRVLLEENGDYTIEWKI